MSKCYSCQTIGEHKTWCIGHISEPKQPINIPQVPEDAVVPSMFLPEDQIEEIIEKQFVTKDSGERQEFSTGMQRDTQTNKPRYDLLDRAMLKRWAELMARGAQKYGEENWRLASTVEEWQRFKASAIRHMYQWLDGDTEEDHASAILFNVAGAEMVGRKLKEFSRERKSEENTLS